MMIRLFEKDSVEFSTLGLCVLSDASSCYVSEELNGEYELTLEYPKSGYHFSDIKKDRIICVKPNPNDEQEPFRIYRITKEINGMSKIYAQHISYDLSNYTVRKFDEATSLSDALQKIQNGTNIPCQFTFSTNIISDKTFKIDKPTNLRNVLGGDDTSILKTYGGELRFNKFNVNLLSSRGEDRGFTIRYGKNLRDITQDITYVNEISGIYPFYSSEKMEYETKEVKTYKKVYINPGHESDPLEYDGLSWYPTKTSAILELIVPIRTGVPVQFANDPRNGEWVNKIVIWVPENNRYSVVTEEEYPPNVTETVMEPITNSNLVTLDDYEGRTDGVYYLPGKSSSDPFKKILTLDLTSNFSELPTQEQLKAETEKYIKDKNLGKVVDSITLSFVKLSDNPEYAYLKPLEVVKLGDTVKVFYEDFDIVSTLKIEKTEYDVINDRYSSVTVGSIQNGITNTVLLRNDNISSLNNNSGYTTENQVASLTVNTITSDYISASEAHLTNTQIEDLETYKIKCSGIIEASEGSIDELVAKLIVADNAQIKDTLEAGNVTVKGVLISTDGFINNDFSAGIDNEEEKLYLLSISTKDKKVSIKNAEIVADDIVANKISVDDLTSTSLINGYEIHASRQMLVGNIQIEPGVGSQEITKTITFTVSTISNVDSIDIIVSASDVVPENTKVTVNVIIEETTSSGVVRYVRVISINILQGYAIGSERISVSSNYVVKYISPASPSSQQYKVTSGTTTYLTISGDVCPIANDYFDLGSSNLKWQDIYAINNVIQTSDRNQKKNINYDISKYDNLFDKLKPASYELVDGESGRTHLGLIAQDIEDSLNETNIPTKDFACFVKSVDEENNKDIYGLRYSELHALEINEIQKLKQQIKTLEELINNK